MIQPGLTPAVYNTYHQLCPQRLMEDLGRRKKNSDFKMIEDTPNKIFPPPCFLLITNNRAVGKLPRHWIAIVHVWMCECVCMWIHSEDICFQWKSNTCLPERSSRHIHNGREGGEGDIKSQWHVGLAHCRWGNVSGVSTNVFLAGRFCECLDGWLTICKLCRGM